MILFLDLCPNALTQRPVSSMNLPNLLHVTYASFYYFVSNIKLQTNDENINYFKINFKKNVLSRLEIPDDSRTCNNPNQSEGIEIEDLTRVVISYEIYETRLRRVS